MKLFEKIEVKNQDTGKIRELSAGELLIIGAGLTDAQSAWAGSFTQGGVRGGCSSAQSAWVNNFLHMV